MTEELLERGIKYLAIFAALFILFFGAVGIVAVASQDSRGASQSTAPGPPGSAASVARRRHRSDSPARRCSGTTRARSRRRT